MESQLPVSKRTLKQAGLVLLLLLVLFLIWKAWRIGGPTFSLYNSYRQIESIRANPTDLDSETALALVRQSHHDVSQIEREMRIFAPLLRGLGWLPGIGGEVAAAPDLLGMTAAFSGIGNEMVSVFEPVLQSVLSSNRPDTTTLAAEALDALARNPAALQEMQRFFAQAERHRANIDARTLSPRVQRQFERLDQVWPLLTLGMELAPHAADALGANDPRTYLIVAQNDDELRATGGFITAVGTVQLERGQIRMVFEDSYDIDDFSQAYPAPPEPLLRYMFAYIWLFRDANWSPDYPTSVAAMLDLYRISRDTDIDGVIALDQVALQRVIGALAPLDVEGWDERVTANNVISLIRQSLTPNRESREAFRAWLETRKDFINNMVAAMQNRITDDPAGVDWPGLAEAMLATMNERHVQVWLAEPEMQAIFAARGWDGKLVEAPQDYLLIVDSNMGFNKVNGLVERELAYHIDLQNLQEPRSVLTVTHRNPSPNTAACDPQPRQAETYQAYMERCYWNYLRVYGPADSRLTAATPFTTPAAFMLNEETEAAKVETLPLEAGKQAWGTFFLVPHNETRISRFDFDLPSQVLQRTNNQQRYQLVVQKQAGTVADPLQVIIDLPPGSQIETISPEPDQRRDQQLVFDLRLQQDIIIDLSFTP